VFNRKNKTRFIAKHKQLFVMSGKTIV